MLGIPLQGEHARPVAVDPRHRSPGAKDPGFVLIDRPPPVETADESIFVDLIPEPVVLKLPRRKRGEKPERFAPLLEFFLRPHDAVVGEGVHFRPGADAAGLNVRELAGGDCLDGADVPALEYFSGDLRRAEDVGAGRDIREIGVRRAPLGGSADAPAVEERDAGPVESPVIVRPSGAEVEDGRSLDEERALFLKERFHIAQVYHRRIDLDLSEIGIDGSVERQVRAEAHLEVSPELRSVPGTAVERIVREVARVFGSRRKVGKKLRLPRGVDILDPDEIGKPGDKAAAVLRREDHIGALVAARDVPPEVDTPRVLVFLLKPELRKRNPHLRGPTMVVAMHFSLPYAVPGVVVPFVVIEGAVVEGALYNDEWNDDSWNGVWEGKVHRDDHGWTAEMRIPFSQLRFQQKDQYTWGINFRRDVARRNERAYVVFTPKNGSGFVSRFPDLVGIENINAARQAEFLPYLTTRAEYSSHLPNDPFNSGSRYTPKFGGDLKMGLGPNLTLDGTVYPDFGQVEVDPAVVNLSDVETFFQEKRPFFIEGSTIFNFGSGGTNNNWGFNWPGVTFLYSRRIGRAPQGSTPNADFADVPSGTDILGAAKITGKVLESWNIGAIQAVTSREFADIQTGSVRSRAEVNPLPYYGVVRAQKEFEKGREALGFFSSLASRQFQDDRLRDQINKDGFVGEKAARA